MAYCGLVSVDNSTIVIAFLGFLGTIFGGMIGAFVTIKTQKPVSEASAEKARAEAHEIEERIRRDLLDRNDQEMKQMQAEIESLRKDFKIVMTFAREVWSGSRKLHDQVIEHQHKYNLEPPVYVPPEGFPTGPLGALRT